MSNLRIIDEVSDSKKSLERIRVKFRHIIECEVLGRRVPGKPKKPFLENVQR